MDAITTAATAGDVIALRVALEELPDYRRPIHALDSLLVLTLRLRHLACFELLLGSGANFHVLSADAGNCIHLSFFWAVEHLLEREANIGARTSALDTPLHLACKRGSANIVELLLKLIHK